MTQQSGAGRSDWLLNTVKQNPEGLLLLAAGAVLLLRKAGASASSRSTMAYSQPSTTSYGGERSYAGERQDTSAGYAEQAKDAVKSYAASASEYAGDAGRAVGEQSQRMVRSAQSTFQSSMNRILQDQPLAIAVAGIAAGAAVAAAFPATALERQTLGPLGDQVAEAAGRMGEQLQQAAGKAGEKLKSAVDERGLNADGLKEVASEVASAFGDTMSGKSGKSGKAEQKSEGGFDQPTFQQYRPDQNR
jgi:hypothetical protein